MAGVVIAPWLETKPTDFSNAEAEGGRLNLERRGQDIGQEETRARLQQAAQEQAQQVQLEKQKIAATQQIANQRTGLAATIAARKYAQQQAYQRAVAGGMDPIQAMMQFGPPTGQSMTGVGQLGLMQARDRMASLPPQFVADPNNTNRTLGVTYAGQYHPATAPKTASTAPGIGAKARLAAAVKAVEKALTPDQVKKAQDNLDKIAEEVDNPDQSDETDDESGTEQAPPQNEADPLGLFQTQ